MQDLSFGDRQLVNIVPLELVEHFHGAFPGLISIATALQAPHDVFEILHGFRIACPRNVGNGASERIGHFLL